MSTAAPNINAQSARLVWTLLIASIAYCLVVLDYLVVVTALPSAQHELHVGLPTLQWAVNSYGITFAAGILIAASFGDRWGRRRVFAWGGGSPFSQRRPRHAPWHLRLGSSSPPAPSKDLEAQWCCR